MLTSVADDISVDDKSCGTYLAHGSDGQAAQNNVMHLLMVPKKEPVKIGNSRCQTSFSRIIIIFYFHLSLGIR